MRMSVRGKQKNGGAYIAVCGKISRIQPGKVPSRTRLCSFQQARNGYPLPLRNHRAHFRGNAQAASIPTVTTWKRRRRQQCPPAPSGPGWSGVLRNGRNHILERIQDVKSSDPEDHRAPRSRGGEGHVSAYGDPGPDRRRRQADSQRHVSQGGESLAVG